MIRFVVLDFPGVKHRASRLSPLKPTTLHRVVATDGIAASR
jgi:hypothetical protein